MNKITNDVLLVTTQTRINRNKKALLPFNTLTRRYQPGSSIDNSSRSRHSWPVTRTEQSFSFFLKWCVKTPVRTSPRWYFLSNLARIRISASTWFTGAFRGERWISPPSFYERRMDSMQQKEMKVFPEDVGARIYNIAIRTDQLRSTWSRKRSDVTYHLHRPHWAGPLASQEGNYLIINHLYLRTGKVGSQSLELIQDSRFGNLFGRIKEMLYS